MQRLEVSGAVRPIYGSLGFKRLIKWCSCRLPVICFCHCYVVVTYRMFENPRAPVGSMLRFTVVVAVKVCNASGWNKHWKWPSRSPVPPNIFYVWHFFASHQSTVCFSQGYTRTYSFSCVIRHMMLETKSERLQRVPWKRTLFEKIK